MNRREFVKGLSRTTVVLGAAQALGPGPAWAALAQGMPPWIPPSLAKSWLEQWQKYILSDARSRFCDKELGEEIGWLISPFLSGFYYGWLATHDAGWVDRLVDWTDAWVGRGLTEPDGFIGWPKREAAGTDTDQLNSYNADSLLGEAMALRPVTRMAGQILKDPALKPKYQAKAESYLKLSEQIFAKWDQRGAWRDTANGGAISIVLPFGMDAASGKWSEGYAKRLDPATGFSHPDNKANAVALWLLALHDATGKSAYKSRAEKWYRLMKSRMKTRDNGQYFVWNYWEPAGAWDYKSDGSPKHWVGVHPNGGYYGIDVEAIVAAREHGLVFDQEDMARLIATNRDFMWNQKVEGAVFQRIDGGAVDPRWKDSPGVLWTALTPYDETLRKVFLANHKPGSWGGMGTTPWFLSLPQS
ncbi:MAG TPA: twin-arginine translocation signal domain-containing protein [Candidatus Acidoferrum sp.]|nr:twin-arginine translocation signal domain-containing protein [Candidatus Acidoferrum sp.]